MHRAVCSSEKYYIRDRSVRRFAQTVNAECKTKFIYANKMILELYIPE